jgi:hypothetical protein
MADFSKYPGVMKRFARLAAANEEDDARRSAADCSALSALGRERMNDVRKNLDAFIASLARRTEKAEEENCDLIITEEEAWRILDILQFVETLPLHLQNS